MSAKQGSIEFAKATAADGPAMRALERRSLASLLSSQVQSPQRNLGVPLEVIRTCLDEITGPSASAYTDQLMQRCDNGEAFAVIARDSATARLEGMIEVSLQRKGVPFYEIAALYGRASFGTNTRKAMVLSELLELFDQTYSDGYPIKATIPGWKSVAGLAINGDLLAVYNANRYEIPKKDYEITVRGCLQMTRMIRQRGGRT